MYLERPSYWRSVAEAGPFPAFSYMICANKNIIEQASLVQIQPPRRKIPLPPLQDGELGEAMRLHFSDAALAASLRKRVPANPARGPDGGALPLTQQKGAWLPQSRAPGFTFRTGQ
jgi:hypothetical protein